MLKINNLFANIGDVRILNGVDLEIGKGELHAVMGPNGSGKSTLCHVLMGNPDFEADGEVTLNDSEILGKPQFERAEDGIFQSYQYPVGLPGVSLMEFVMASTEGLNEDEIISVAKKFNVEQFLDREVNVDLSGGEKKRSELFQLALKKPKLALLDEIDSGLDIDALKIICQNIVENLPKDSSLLIITHYPRILEYLKPDFVHIMYKGKIIKTGDMKLVDVLEEKGYDAFC